MPEAGSEVEVRGDGRVRDLRVVYAVVPVGIDGDEGLVWF